MFLYDYMITFGMEVDLVWLSQRYMPFKTMYGCVFIVRELVQYLDVSLLLIISPPLRPAGIEVDSEHCHLLYSIRSCTPIQHLLFITYHAIIKG